MDQENDTLQELTVQGIAHGPLGRPWKGIDPSMRGRSWLLPPDELEELDRSGLIHWYDGLPYIQMRAEEIEAGKLRDVARARRVAREWLKSRSLA